MKLNKISTYKINLLRNMFEADFLLRFDKYDFDHNIEQSKKSSFFVNNKSITICNIEHLLSEMKQIGHLLQQIKIDGSSKVYLVAESPFIFGVISQAMKDREYANLSQFQILPSIVQNEKHILNSGGVAAIIFFGELSSPSVRAARRIALRHPLLYVDIGGGSVARSLNTYTISTKLQTLRQIVFVCVYIAQIFGVLSKKVKS